MTALFKRQEENLSIAIDQQTLLSVFKLSPNEAAFLHVLLLANDWVGARDFPTIAYPIRQVIYTLRKKLRGSYGVFIANDGEGRYAIAYQHKKIIYSMVQRVVREDGYEHVG